MPIFLPQEMETEVYGTGSGFIRISQKNIDGQEAIIWLSVHQFSTIFNHEKTIIREAVTPDESQ